MCENPSLFFLTALSLFCSFLFLHPLGLVDHCVNVPIREATKEEILFTHTEKHYDLINSLKDETYVPNVPYIFLDDVKDTYACRETTTVALR